MIREGTTDGDSSETHVPASGSFAIVPAEVIAQVPAIRSSGLAVYVALASYADSKRQCHPSINTLAETLGISTRQVIRKIRLLESCGLISTTRRKSDDGRSRTNVYQLKQPRDTHVTRDSENHVTPVSKPCDISNTDHVTFPTSPCDKIDENHVTKSTNEGQPCDTSVQNHVTPVSDKHNHKNITKKETLSSRTQQSKSVQKIIEHYQSYHPKSKPGRKESSLVGARLREGFSVEDLCQAIDGCHRSPFHCGKNDQNKKYQQLALIVRDSEKVNNFLACAEQPPAVSGFNADDRSNVGTDRPLPRIKANARPGGSRS